MNKSKWIEKALEKGIDAFEIYESSSKSKEVTWFDHQMDTFVTSNVTGISLRGIVEGNVSYISMEQMDDSKMDEVLDSLKAQALTISSDEKTALIAPMEFEKSFSKYQWKKPEMSLVYSVMDKLENELLNYDPRVIQVSDMEWNESQSARKICNSLGLDLADEDGAQLLYAGVVVKENEEIKTGFKIQLVEDLNDFDIKKFAAELCQETLDKLNGSSISSRTCKAIFKKEAMTQLFSAFSSLFTGDMINKGISPLHDKVGKKVFSDLITIVDNPKNTDALSVVNFDDEGYPTKEKIVVNHGVFETVLHSQKTAAKAGTVSTGNGFKSGYAGSVGVSPFNMCILPGEDSLKELEEKMGTGIVIDNLEGLHAGIDFVTTNFSLQASGYWVENGKKVKPVSLITAASSFLSLMNHVIAVGSDLDWKYQSIAAPSILFSECAIAGE